MQEEVERGEEGVVGEDARMREWEEHHRWEGYS